mgnify:CR=1 FL=1|tara:strand:+ start:2979 stop:3536 length:558 start_codon:yes stop_codon:yes gene_type:complete
MAISPHTHRFNDDLYSKLEEMAEYPYTVTHLLHEAMADYIQKQADAKLCTKPAKPTRAAKRFTKPDVPELALYFHEKGSVTCNDDANSFFDYFETCGWVVGKARKPMKCWKAAVRTWMKNGKLYETNKRTSTNDKQTETRRQAEAIRANLSQCSDGNQVLGENGRDIRQQMVRQSGPDDGGQFVY